jgi:hypothetical protein
MKENHMKKLLLTIITVVTALPSMAVYYVAGDFQGWNPASSSMTETSPGSGIFQATFGGMTASSRHEFKVTQGDWGTAYPGANSWLYADASGNVTITYDSNSYSDGWSGASGRLGLSTDPGTWTATGDWGNGWNNANPATAMTPIGGGIYELAYAVASPGQYQYKAVVTGTPTWDAIGNDSRNINAATWGFTTTDPNQTVDFFVNALNGTIKADVVAVPEPSTLALLGAGLAGLLCLQRRR